MQDFVHTYPKKPEPEAVSKLCGFDAISEVSPFCVNLAAVQSMVKLFQSEPTLTAFCEQITQSAIACSNGAGEKQISQTDMGRLAQIFSPLFQALLVQDDAKRLPHIVVEGDRDLVQICFCGRHAAELPSYEDHLAMFEASYHCFIALQSVMEDFFHHRCHEEQVQKSQIPQVLHVLDDYFDHLLFGMGEGSIHIGALAASIIEGHQERYGSPITAEDLRTTMEDLTALMFMRKMTELNIFEVKIFDALVLEHFNPYAMFFDEQGKPEFGFNKNCILFAQGILRAAKNLHSRFYNKLDPLDEDAAAVAKQQFCSSLSGDIEILFSRHISADRRDTERRKKIVETILGMYQHYPCVDFEKDATYGCPATRAKIFNDWYKIMARSLAGYYEIAAARA